MTHPNDSHDGHSSDSSGDSQSSSKGPVSVGPYQCGPGESLLLIAGPCVLETEDAAMRIAEHLASVTRDLPIQLVFKGSFDKANRTSLTSYRGPGIDKGLQILDHVRTQHQLPVTTDIHEPSQARAAAEVCELLQIPAFLARQTDLLLAAAETGRAVNVKKGQFLAPEDMEHVVNKLNGAGCRNVLLCERGTFFGYGRLVNDMGALPTMWRLAPVVFDATHSVQQPGGLGGKTGGRREMVEPLARAAVAIGVDGLFLETPPNPSESPSDGPNMVPLDQLGGLVERLLAIRSIVESMS